MTRLDREERAMLAAARTRRLARWATFPYDSTADTGPGVKEWGSRYGFWLEDDRLAFYTTARMFDGMFWSVGYERAPGGVWYRRDGATGYHELRRDAKTAAHKYVFGYNP